jgi:hypothetical protein
VRHEAKQSKQWRNRSRTLADVLLYENPPLIARLCRKEGMSESEAKTAFADTLKFLYLCGTSEENFVPTAKIDAVWHHFILFTAAYADFCLTFFGKFIHHIPAEAQSEGDYRSNCSKCSSCEGGGTGRSIEPGSLPTLEYTVNVARNRFGELSSNWS